MRSFISTTSHLSSLARWTLLPIQRGKVSGGQKPRHQVVVRGCRPACSSILGLSTRGPFPLTTPHPHKAAVSQEPCACPVPSPGVTRKPEWPRPACAWRGLHTLLRGCALPLVGGASSGQGLEGQPLGERSSPAGFCQLSQRCPEHLQPHAQPSQGHLGGHRGTR